MPEASPSQPPARHSSIDLQLCVLRNLPSPILVLSPSRTVVFANRAAGRILGQPDSKSASHSLHGRTLTDLRIKLLHDQVWDVVLDKLVVGQKEAAKRGGTEDAVHELDVVLTNGKTSYGETHFRVLASIVTAEDGAHYVLNFEKSPDLRINSEKPNHTAVNVVAGQSDTRNGAERLRKSTVRSNDVFRMKHAVFDSCNIAGFIVSADEQLYLANKKMRNTIGDAIGGANGLDSISVRSKLLVYDDKFKRRLEPFETPSAKVVRTRAPFANYRCGFVNVVTGAKSVMNVSGECLYDDETGEFLGGLCWCNDMQDYSDFLNEQTRNRLASHETICDLMPHFVWTCVPGGICDWFSQRWYDFTGLTREESIGTGFEKAVHPDDVSNLWARWNDLREMGNECEIEVRYRRHDGIYRWMLARACPLLDEQGNILKWYGTNTDIHDLVMARLEAARNKMQILTVLQHGEVNVFSIDKNRKITMAEGGMLWKVHGKTMEDKSLLVGQDAIEASQASQHGGIPNYERHVLEILAGKAGMASFEDKIADRIYRTRLVAELEHDSLDGGQEPAVIGVLGLGIDVTDMKARVALEVDNNRLTMEERAATDSNRIKSQFLANMSHEMRTPTAGVIGMVDLLAEDRSLSAEQREYVDSIQLSAKALLTIVNDILDFSKIESGRLDIEEVPFNLSNVVGDLCKLLSMFANQKGLSFSYTNTIDDSLELVGDPGRIRQVLSNLLTNALKFTTDGSVSISVSPKPMDGQLAGEDHVEVEFVIEDTGIGIEKKVLDNLFKPFRQGDSSTARLFGGTGLGLTISKNLATLMHGSIKLESTPSVGSKATFAIPLKISSWCLNPSFLSSSPPNLGFRMHVPNNSKKWSGALAHRSVNQDLLNQRISSSVTNYSSNPSHSLKRASSIDTVTMTPHLSPEQRSKCHILVVEDNAINHTIAIKTIKKLGFPVTATWNGREALSYLRSPSKTQPRPSIILMDVQMPVMDGYEATRQLRTRKEYSESENDELKLEGVLSSTRGPLSKIPVIAMTASAIQGDREKCHDAGMDDYLAKPVEKSRLEDMLVKWGSKVSSG